MGSTGVKDGKHNTLNPSASERDNYFLQTFLDFPSAVLIVRSNGLFIVLQRLFFHSIACYKTVSSASCSTL